MSKTVEDLLKPRYKVIADYPKSIYEVGTIIDAGWRSEDLLYCDHNGPRMRDYPHLFKKLEWWQDRQPDEMPEYVIMLHSSKRVMKCVRHNLKATHGLGFENEDGWIKSYINYLPATQSEYDQYISSGK